MGIKIGCPSLKLAFKRSTKAKATRTGRLQAVACEALETRWGKDKDIDRSKTPENEYTGIRNPFEFAAALKREAEAYSEARKAAGGRGLRSDASIGFALVLKPPAEFVNGLSENERNKFMGDLLQSFRDSTQDIIAPDAIKSIVKHKDEQGDHWHVLGLAKTPSGEISADKVVGPALWKALNQSIPDSMRQKGWEVDECVNYDPDHAATLEADELREYKAKCRAKRKPSGKDSEQYKREKDMEKLRAENEALKRKLQEAEAQRPPRPSQKPQEAPEKPRVEKPRVEAPRPPERPQKPQGGKEKQMADEAKARIAALLGQMDDKPGKAGTLDRVNRSISSMAREMARAEAPRPPERPQKPQEAPEKPRVEKPRVEAPRPPEQPQEAPGGPQGFRPLPANAPTLKSSPSKVHDTGREMG